MQHRAKIFRLVRNEEVADPIPVSSNEAIGSASRTGRALAVGEVSALSDLDNITVGIADVAANLAVFGYRLRDELGLRLLRQQVWKQADWKAPGSLHRTREDRLVGAVGIELQAALKTRKLLIL